MSGPAALSAAELDRAVRLHVFRRTAAAIRSAEKLVERESTERGALIVA